MGGLCVCVWGGGRGLWQVPEAGVFSTHHARNLSGRLHNRAALSLSAPVLVAWCLEAHLAVALMCGCRSPAAPWCCSWSSPCTGAMGEQACQAVAPASQGAALAFDGMLMLAALSLIISRGP